MTYNHAYWDFSDYNAGYSYARAMAAGGYATFAYDRIGDGESTRPADVNLQDGASTARQVVAALESGVVGPYPGIHFGRVVEVGHSFGSFIAWQDAGSDPYVAGVIVTGALHKYTTEFLQAGQADMWPANGDSVLRGLGLPLNYTTTMPGKRSTLFYNTADADPAVISSDEQHKDTATVTEIMDATALLPIDAKPLPTSISAPVLVIQRANDSCSATARRILIVRPNPRCLAGKRNITQTQNALTQNRCPTSATRSASM